MAKTIKQIADEIGVSKTAIRKKIENLGLRSSLQKNGNQFAIDENQEKLIKSAFLEEKTETKTETSSRTETETVSTLVSMLQRELEIKNKQIEELNERLAESQKLLDQQQQLTALQEQKLQLLIEQKDEEQAVKEEPEKKHWWQFGRKSADRH